MFLHVALVGKGLSEREIRRAVEVSKLDPAAPPKMGAREPAPASGVGADSVCAGDAPEVHSEATSGWTRR
jgi:hypothetical protein